MKGPGALGPTKPPPNVRGRGAWAPPAPPRSAPMATLHFDIW